MQTPHVVVPWPAATPAIGFVDPIIRARLLRCSEPQLRAVKRLCDVHIARHRQPPTPEECGKSYTQAVLGSVVVKNKRFQLELRRQTKKGQLYVNGPYLYSYSRRGNVVYVQYFRKS